MQARKFPLPSFPDLIFASLFGVLLLRSGGLESLLADGDTGWHIRTGEWILGTGAVPRHDLFSFTRPGAPWTAWEWLADILFARLHTWGGLAAVAAACAAALCLASAILLGWLLARGGGLWLSGAVTLAAASASTVHYLARPHVFSILLFTLGLRLLDLDRRNRTRWMWILPALTALWCNLHGGFTLWLAAVWLLAVTAALERDRPSLMRYTLLAALCSLATLANPYGWNLHRHILDYLASSWIMTHVQEFQPPQIRAENMLVFAVLLVAGVALAACAASRGRRFEPLLVWALGLASLRSARHVPLFAIAAAPLIASECALLWGAASGRRRPGSMVSILWDAGRQLGCRCALTGWTPVFGLLLAFAVPHLADFPPARFPVRAVAALQDVLAPTGAKPRILTSDQWADYLIYRLYPRQRVFFDGRSDFYGESVGAEYEALLNASPRARAALNRYGFDMALLPHDWALERVLESDSSWQRVYRDSTASLFIHHSKETRATADFSDGQITCGWTGVSRLWWR
jgi:hypothetical protein